MQKYSLTNNKNEEVKRVLVIQTAFIGDVILITPLIRGLKKVFPSAKIDVMVIPQTSEILDNNPNINQVILFDKRSNKIKAFIKIAKVLRKNKYDIAISPHSSLTTALLMFVSDIPARIGFARWSAQYFLTHKLTHIKNTFKIKKNLHLLSPFSDEEFSIQTELFFREGMKLKADLLLSEFDSDVKKIIAVAPGSMWFTKRWPLEFYKELVSKLSKNNYGIVFIGSKAEHQICEEVAPGKKFINLSGKLNLLESAAVINKCDLMVCNDSGAMHLANAVKTDVFVFFGPTVQRIGYSPIGKNDVVFETELECRPCGSHGSKKCPLKHFNCMRSIEPEFVYNQIIKKLE
ncbi:MAG: lipopolysaccharide heptosyltransferase II [Melioribacteraceae bacterium]|nr:lipopolysaccharide heptosyltransferase II [Melioribacteraceae bacterium]